MSNPDVLPPIPANIASLTSPLIVGILLNWGLFGILSTQVYVYYLSFPDDRLRNKIVVYGLYVLECVQTAMTAADLCFWFSSGFGNMNSLDLVNLSPFNTPILCSIIAWIVQCFYAFRIYMLRRSFLGISVLVMLMSFSQVVGGIIVGSIGFRLGKFSRFHDEPRLLHSAHVWISTGIVCDFLVTSTLIWLLFKTRKESDTQGASARILARLVHLIVQTNVLTTLVSLISLISYRIFPESPLFRITTVIAGKLYSNSLLATLNNRVIARRLEMDDIVFQDIRSLYAPSDMSASNRNLA